jgi:hypothetical protein
VPEKAPSVAAFVELHAVTRVTFVELVRGAALHGREQFAATRSCGSVPQNGGIPQQ